MLFLKYKNKKKNIFFFLKSSDIDTVVKCHCENVDMFNDTFGESKYSKKKDIFFFLKIFSWVSSFKLELFKNRCNSTKIGLLISKFIFLIEVE